MKLNPLYMALGAIFFATPLALAQSNDDQEGVIQSSEKNEIVFTANRADQKLDTVGSTINVISEQQLNNGQYQRVSDALSTLPGVNITRSGANGLSGAFIRGMSSDNVLVMIDGVIVNNPSSAGRGFDFSTLDTLNIERIEVLKGPQSTLYGSSATAGVIQMFTKKGGPQRTTVTLEGGSYEHVKTTVQTQGQTDTLMYSLALGLNQEHGISSADKKLEGNSERDKFKNRDASFYVNYAPLDWINFDVMARYDRQHTDLDLGGGPKQDALYYYQKSERWLGRFAINTILFDEQWLSSLIYDITDSRNRNYQDPDDKYNTTFSRSAFKGRLQTISWQNTLTLHPDFQTLFGFAYNRESMSTFTNMKSPFWSSDSSYPKKSIHQKSFYVDQHLNFNDKFFNTIGLRYEDHSEFGDKTTYRLTSRYNINDFVAVKGSYGTGFKAPTLYQLYEPLYGNKDLKAETSKGFDAGIVLTPIESTTVELTYFQQKIKDRIIFDSPTSKYKSSDEFKSKGVEFSTNTQLNEQWAFGVNYTYTDARDYLKNNNISISNKAVRVPKHMAGGFMNFKPMEQWNIFAEAKYNGSTVSNLKGWSAQRNLKPYWMVNLATNYAINDDVSIYAHVNNLLDKDYYTVWGYGEKRINGAIGVKISF